MRQREERETHTHTQREKERQREREREREGGREREIERDETKERIKAAHHPFFLSFFSPFSLLSLSSSSLFVSVSLSLFLSCSLQRIGSDLGEGVVEEEVEEDIEEVRRKKEKSGRQAEEAATTDAYHSAAFCMMDALAGRDKHGMMTLSSAPPLVRTAFAIQTSNAEWAVFCIAVFVYVVVAFTEDQFPTSATALTSICLAVFVSDIALKMVYMTPLDYVGKIWNAAQVGPRYRVGEKKETKK